MTRSPDRSPDFAEAGEHVLPASFFGLRASAGVSIHVLSEEGCVADLSAEERQRAASFGSTKRRHEFIRGRTLLRRVVARRTGVAPPEIRLRVAPTGGFLPLDDALHTSLTHSGDVAAVALGPVPLGLDVERVRAVSDALQLRLLAANERLPDAAHAVLCVWTAKEAVLKATGSGLRAGLCRVHLYWEQAGQSLLFAHTQVGEARFAVSVRLYGDAVWALALVETATPDCRSALIS